MTFPERYKIADSWQDKALIMSLYHSAMTSRVKHWTISNTAEIFEVSIGLVSENLRLAHAMDIDERTANFKTRAEALQRVERRRYAK